MGMGEKYVYVSDFAKPYYMIENLVMAEMLKVNWSDKLYQGSRNHTNSVANSGDWWEQQYAKFTIRWMSLAHLTFW